MNDQSFTEAAAAMNRVPKWYRTVLFSLVVFAVGVALGVGVFIGKELL